MVTAHLSRGKAVLVGLLTGVCSLLVTTLSPALPAHAASTVQLDWVNTTTIHLSGSAIQTPIDMAGDLVGDLYGTPPGSQSFVAISNGPVQMSFGCKVSITVDITPDNNYNLDYSKGEVVFNVSSPSTCSLDNLKKNVSGIGQDPNGGTDDLSIMSVPIGGVDKRAPSPGTDSGNQNVNVTAGMGNASDFNNIPATDVFTLCEAKGDYANNADQLFTDCLNKQASALSAPPITSNDLTTLQDGKGPKGGDEKAWLGQFKNVKAGIYVVCSANFKNCQLFTKNPGQNADVYVSAGSFVGSTVPGTPPGQGDTQNVCTTGPGLAGAIGWVLCPIVQLIASATQFFEDNIIVPFLTVSPLTTNADNPIYILWQDVRNFANVGFILFFLFVIFSQSTSIGLSNYGIKRILPRMAFAVVGANLSYFIVAFVIDAFNIFGAGISQLVIAALQQAGTTQLNTGTSAGTVRSIFTLGGAALVTIVATGGAAIGWFFSFLGMALLVVVVVVVVLVVRQLAIIMLVIISPVLIIFSMMPNLDKYYDKGRSTLTQLLLMYPMIVLLFASGKIFGVILQQPDFKLAGDGVSDDVAQAVRVILQFLVYVVPLVFLPFTFMASGSLMKRGFSLLHHPKAQEFVKKGGQNFNSNVVKPRRAEMRVRAARRGGPIGWAAGYGMRRDQKRADRERELNRAKQGYIANQYLQPNSSLSRSAGRSIGGQGAVTRAQAGAVSQLEKQRQEEISNEAAIFSNELRRLGISAKEFNNGFNSFVNGTGTGVIQGTAADPSTASGRAEINLNQDPRVLRAALNSAANSGEVGTIENARMNGAINQNMLDEVIRNNEGKLKEKGGYHLATKFDLAIDRMSQSNDVGKAIPGTTITDPKAMKTEMAKQRLFTAIESSSADIAGMKFGVLESMRQSIFQTDADGNVLIDPTTKRPVGVSTEGRALLNSISQSKRDQLKTKLLGVQRNPNLSGKSQNNPAINDIHDIL